MLQVPVMPAAFGNKLRELRKAAKMTQEELARKANLRIGTIRNLEQTAGNPTFTTLCAIARALGVSLAKFDDLCEEVIEQEGEQPDDAPAPPKPTPKKGKKK